MSTPRLEDLPRYTYDDYVQWEGRWELIQGIAHAMSPAPSILHQSISQRLAGQLERALEHCQDCHALLPVDWKIDEETTVQPDHLVVCGELDKTAYLTKTPALIFEILSTSTAHKDRTTKFRLYEREGVGQLCRRRPARASRQGLSTAGGALSQTAGCRQRQH